MNKVKLKLFYIGLTLLLLQSCSHKMSYSSITEPIDDKKVIALSGQRFPWVVEIEQRLKSKGFTVLRYSSVQRVTEKAPDKDVSYQQASARYVVQLNGFAPLEWAFRCMGGGYKFNYISAEVIDTKTNQSIYSFNDSGYSENCPPVSGSIFTDLVDGINGLWKN